ncbi:trigger factor [bacterium]|nr:trigger factor [bacterium]
MKSEVSSPKTWKKELSVEVTADEVAPHRDDALRSLQKRIRIDGFRKGKVPVSILRQRFGQALESELAEDLAEVFYRKAVDEHGLHPVAPAVLKDVQYGEGEPLRFKAEIEVEPEIQPKDYEGIKVDRETWTINEEQIDRVIDDLRERHAEVKPSEAGARVGDLVHGDIQALDASGVPIIGRKWNDRWIELGRPPLGDKVRDQLTGVTAGETRQFTVIEKTPDEKGKHRDEEKRYAIQVRAVHEKNLPAVDDGFAKKTGDFENVEAMRQGLRKILEADRDVHTRKQTLQRIADQIVRKNDFELPPSLVEYSFRRFFEEFEKQNPGAPETEVRARHLPMIAWNLKWRRIWTAIGSAEGIAVTDEDAQAAIQRQIEVRPSEEKRIQARFKNPSRMEELRDALLEEKVMDFLLEKSKIKDVVVAAPAAGPEGM